MKKVKIAVLHKEFYPDYADAYLIDGKSVGTCPLLEIGDEFIFEGSAKMPDGFCPWAWIDIYRSVRPIEPTQEPSITPGSFGSENAS
ncbi:MAG: TIGR04076 family protein [Clostridia bacterium]